VAALAAGLTVKLLDTEDQRDRATLEIYSEGKRLGKFRKLPRDSVITVLAADGAWYEVVVMSVSRQTQSVTVGLRAVG
jgi:hypothetical protein